MNSRKLFTTILILFNPITVYAHSDPAGDILDTGAEFQDISWVFVSVGALIFVLIISSALWLITRKSIENENPTTYMDKINLFGKNARLYILHIQGMSLTYGVRVILYNIYLLYIFKDGVRLLNYELEPVMFIGILMAMGSLITGIMAVFNGIIVDKIGKKWSFISGDFLGAMTILAIIFIQTPNFVIAAQIVRSVVMSIHSIAEGPFIYEQSTERERVHLFSVSSGFSTLAAMSGNLMGGVVPLAIALLIFNNPLVSGNDAILILQIGLFLSVVLWLISLIPTFFLREDPEILKRNKKISASSKLAMRNVTNWKTIMVFTLSSVFIGTGAGMFVSFFSLFFLLKYHASATQIAIIFATGSLFVALGNFITPILAEKFGKAELLVATRMISIIFIIMLPLSNILLIAGVFYLLRIVFMVGTFPTESALAMETVNDDERTTMEAIRLAGSSIFAALGFLIGGYYIQIGDFQTPFFISAILYFIATGVFWMYFKNGKADKLALEVKKQMSMTIPS